LEKYRVAGTILGARRFADGSRITYEVRSTRTSADEPS
jgi:hypothetical protein